MVAVLHDNRHAIDRHTDKPRQPRLRQEDVFFLDDGLKNLAARVMALAVADAQRIGKGKKPQGYTEDGLMKWVFSERCRLWALFLRVDPDDFESRICKLVDNDAS